LLDVILRPTKKISEVDVRLEKAGILFNIGSVKSNIAASADRFTAEGLAIAGKEFQVGAAGPQDKYNCKNLL
jgi:hypothetical protein